MAGNWVSGSVSVLVKPYLSDFTKDIKKELASSGLESVGRDIAEDITAPLEKEAKDAGKKAHEEIEKEVGKPVKKKLSLGQRFKAAGKKAGQEFKQNFQRMIKGGLLLGGTAIVAGGGLFLKDAITEAGNLEQSLGGLEAVFGANADAMKEFSGAAAQELGLSKNEYNELAALMGTQLKAGGLDGSALTDGVQQFMGLSADVASLFGGTTQEAANAMNSALRGEFEPMRRYGVSLNMASIEAKALEMGLIEQGESMDAASQSAATQALILEQTADAQGNFAKESDTLQGQQQRAAAAFANTKASVGEMLLPALTGLFTYVNENVIPKFEELVGWIKNELIPAFKEFGGWVQDNSAWLAPLGVALGVVAVAIGAIAAAKAIWSGVTNGLAAAQAFLNTTLLASPITWIVIGVIALVTALILAYKKSETFRNIVNSVWASIKSAIGAVLDWITGTLWPGIQAVWQAIANGAIWLYENAIQPAWAWIKQAIAAVADWVMGTLVPWLQSAWTAIGNAMSWLYNTIILPVWNAIKTAIAIVVTAVLVYVDLLKWYFNNVLAPVFTWLYEVIILPVWNGIKAAIGAVVTWFRDVAWPMISLVIDWLKQKFELWKQGMKIIWDYVMNNVINPVIVWFQTVAWPLISSIIDWIKNKFELWKQGMKIIWDFVMNNVINPVISWFQNTAWPLISSIVDWIKNKFEMWKLGMKIIWDFVKNRIILPFLNWFRDVLFPAISRVVDALKTAFNTARDRIRDAWDAIKNKLLSVYENNIKPMVDKFKGAIQGLKDTFNNVKDGITEAWGKIRDAGKKPVKFVVQDIIRDGIVKKFNSVAETFGIDGIDESKFTVGWSAGGYTGPGSKYQPAGVVHADEFVIRKESQNSLRRSAPGFLDALNRHGSKALEGAGFGYASGGWVKPFQGNYASNSPYGPRNGRLHAGMDFPTPTGTPMIAVSDGTIVGRAWNSAAGNKLSLQTDMPGIVAGYHHLDSYAAALGESVKKGQIIGYSGNTGGSTGPHLHFSIKRDGTYVNPDSYLAGTGAAGTGSGGGILNPFAGLWDSLKEKIREGVGDSPLGDALFNMPKKLIDGGLSFVSDKIAALGDWAYETVDAAAGAARWTPVATEALLRENQFGPKRLASLLRRMGQESSYNPRAINNWDSNAAAGNSSRGLMQVIPTTFAAHRDTSLPNDIYDPLANIVASIRYTLARYGNLETGWDRAGGYANGGLVRPLLHDQGGYLQPGLSVIENRTRKPEYILNQKQWDAVYEGRNQGGRDITLNQYINSTNATANAVASGVTWELRRKGITGR